MFDISCWIIFIHILTSFVVPVLIGLKFTCFDMSGQSKYRSLWEKYYADVDGTCPVALCWCDDVFSLGFRASTVSGCYIERLLRLWSLFCTGIVWVIDSTDKVRMCVVQDEIENMLEHEQIRGKNFPILFFANKVSLSFQTKPKRKQCSLCRE